MEYINQIRSVCFCVLIFSTTILYAQEKEVKSISLWGHVLDSFTKAGVSAKITLMNRDSIVLDSVLCNNKGNDATYRFRIPRKPEHFIIKAEHKDFETKYVNFRIDRIARNSYFDAPWHYMKRKVKTGDAMADMDIELGEVVVKATKIRMIHKGDTVIFNADAFNVPSGSMLSTLVKQLPNTEINDHGEIFVNGRKIDELMLNGESFYKGNNKVMLDNLPYYVVKDISVYEKSTEKSVWRGSDIEKKDFVMDVQMKKEYMGRFFGNAEAASGTKERYLGRLLLMNITNHSRLMAFGGANNINDMRRPGEDGIWDASAKSDGIIERKEAHLSYMYNDKEKRFLENIESALLVQDNNEANSAFTHQYQNDISTYKILKNNILRKNIDVNVSNTFKMEHPFKPFMFTSYINLNYSNHKDVFHSQSAAMDYNPCDGESVDNAFDSIFASSMTSSKVKVVNYKMNDDYVEKFKNLTLSGNAYYARKLKNGDNLSFYMNGSYTRIKPNNVFHHIVKDIQNGFADDNRNIYVNQGEKNYDYNTNLTYDIVLNGWTCKPSLAYNQSYSNRKKLNYRLDWLNNGWNDIEMLALATLPLTEDSLMLAYDFNNSNRYHILSRDYCGKLSFYNNVEIGDASNENDLSLCVHKKYDRLNYDGFILDTIAVRSKLLFDANYSFKHVWNKNNKSFNINIGYTSSLPDYTDLVGEPDTSDPSTVYYHNEALKGSQDYNLDLRFVTNRRPINQTMTITGHMEYKHNGVVTKTIYDKANTKYHNMPVNVNGNWRADVSYRIYRDLDKAKHFQANSTTSLSYIHNVGYSMVQDWNTDIISKINTCQLDQRLSLLYTYGKFSSSLNGRMDWRYSTGSLSSFTTLNRVRFNYGLNMTYTTPFELSISTDGMMTSRRGYEDPAMNSNDFVWNASISYSFGRKKNFTVLLDAYDILHGVETRYELFNGVEKMEVWLNNIPSYYMGHFIVKF